MAKGENLLKGALYSIFAFFFMAVFGAFVKAADNAAWANFFAFVAGSIVLLCTLFKSGFSILKTDHFWLHFFRAFFGVSASLAYVFAIRFTPLLDATLLYNATPLFIPFFSIFFLKCKPTLLTWIAILIGYIGVLFIIHPTAHILQHPGDLLGLASGILLALAFTFVKMLTKTEPFFRIVFFYFFLATLLQLPFLYFFGPFPSIKTIAFSALAGLSLVLAQLGIAKSYSFAPASKVGIFQYSAVVSVGIIDYLVWGVKPTIFEYIGTIVVASAGILIISRSGRELPSK